MNTVQSLSMEIIEEYEILGEKRFRLKIKGTNLVVNVSASNPSEAKEKAYKLLEKMNLIEEIKRIINVKKEEK